MRFRGFSVFMLCACAASGFARGQQAGPGTDVSGDWIMSADLFGNTLYLRTQLKQDGDKLSGTYSGDKLTTGTVNGGAIICWQRATMAPPPT